MDGFTLLELLIVLAVMGLVAALVIPNLRMPGIATGAAHAARDIAFQLAAARQQAIFTNRAVDLTVDVERFTIRVGDGVLRSVQGVRRLSLLTTQRSSRAGSAAAIRFFPDGSSDGGEIALTGENGRAARIRINWLTGRIDIDV